MRESAVSCLLLLAIYLAGPLPAAGAGPLDPVAAELADLRAGLDPGDKAQAKVLKTIDKLLAALQAIGPATPLTAELKIAGKAAGTIEKKLAGQGDLGSLLAGAAAGYRALVESARERISVAVALMPLTAKDRADLVKRLTAVDRGLSALPPGAAPSAVLKLLARFAKSVVSPPSLPGVVEATWVVNSVTVAPAAQGLDLDGDMTVDNQLGALAAFLTLFGVDLDAMLASAISASPNVLLLKMWWSGNQGGVLAGLVNGLDTDADLTDNFSGSEAFAVATGLDGEGHPLARVATSFTAQGGYATELFESGGIDLPGLEVPLPENLPLAMSGTASAAANSGYIGFAIPVDVLAAALVLMGQPDYTATLRTLADIDLDPGTPGNEALSAALGYTAVPAGIQ